jgi:hypothetical protein
MLVAHDASADAVLAAAQRSPLLLTFADSVPEATLAEIERLRPDRITIVGGSDRVDATVENQLRTRFPALVIERFAGADRYDTAARLAGEGRSDVLIVDGRLEQIELFAAPAVAAQGNRGLLFGRSDCAPEAIRPFLSSRSVISIGPLGTGSCR